MRYLFLAAASFVILAAVFSEPGRLWITQNEAGFVIESAGRLPASYGSIPLSSYLNLQKSLNGTAFIEVKSKSEGGNFLNFVQSADNGEAKTVKETPDLGTEYSRENISLNKIPIQLSYHRSGARSFAWIKNGKAYRLTTDDRRLSLSEIGEIEKSIGPAKPDVLAPIKNILGFTARFTGQKAGQAPPAPGR